MSFFNTILNRKPAPARLYPRMSWKETHELELIFIAGLGVIVLLFIVAFMFVGQMAPTMEG